MLKKLFEIVRAQVFLVRDVRETSDKVTHLRQEFDDLADVVVKLQYEVQNLRDEERHEREKVLPKLENSLLKIERQLPRKSK
jgi:hypothetical protein